MNRRTWNLRLHTLTIFRHITEDKVFAQFMRLLEAEPSETEDYIDEYCLFVSYLYEKDVNFSRYIYRLVMNDENTYVHAMAKGKKVSPLLQKTVMQELTTLQEISLFKPKDLLEKVNYSGFLPEWETKQYDFIKKYNEHIRLLPKQGYGVFAKYYAFGIQQNALVPIHHPDPQKLSDLIGYQKEREKVIKNTLAFIQGLEANNVLLYGDAGTGKSSTVKAIVNEYHDQGLRLIEVKKSQLSILPDIMDTLQNNPLHFIIFIDDLSFTANDDNFIALKNILEGGIQNNQKNIVVYATSNRRHFVQESFDNRKGSDLFINDQIQETMSLSARFGLTVTFSKPMKDLYLEIVGQLADRYGLKTDRNQLFIDAEAFAIRTSGRSPRTAKQFVETVKINESIE